VDRTILIDNDALLKLARYGLLNEVVVLFDCIPSNVRVLATAKYSLLPASNRLRLCEDEESASRLEEFLKVCTPLDVKPADLELFDMLNANQNIDAGESLLLTVGARDENALIITGDKRSLAALCSDESIAHISNALLGRIISMEILFLKLIENNFAHIQKCVRSKPGVDKAINIAFGVTVPADLNSVREGLHSYIQHLRYVTGDLLYPS
jgi:hypothetical protein